VILSPEEVRHFLSCVPRRKGRTVLTVCYAAGLRVSEAIALKPTDIDSQRMTLRVTQGKGAKDRDVMLSEQLLVILRDWYRVARPAEWMFRGVIPGRDQRCVYVTTSAQWSLQTGHAAQYETHLRNASAACRCGHQHDPRLAGSVDTTNIYAEVDLEMKAKALAQCEIKDKPPAKQWRRQPDLMEFLSSL
jgi:integrase